LEHDWSVDSLADEIHVSRSVLAQRFNDFVGVPPMQYLKRWRLAIAARMLRGARDRSTAERAVMRRSMGKFQVTYCSCSGSRSIWTTAASGRGRTRFGTYGTFGSRNSTASACGSSC
jgi:AraC-like DNA-binding protein